MPLLRHLLQRSLESLPDRREPEELIHLLHTCASLRLVDGGRKLHAHISRLGLLERDGRLANHLIDMYGKCGHLEDAKAVFQSLDASKRSSLSWSALITAHGSCGSIGGAVGLLDDMEEQGILPDQTALLTALNLCSTHGALAEGIVVHKRIADRGLEKNVIISNAITNMYGKCGKIDQAKDFFDRMYFRDTVSWNTIVSAYAKNGHQSDAVKMLFVMQLEGVKIGKIGFVTLLKACCDKMFLKSGRLIHSCLAEDGLHETDVTAGTSLVHMYAKCGSLAEAREIFERMSCKNKFAWSAMISAYVEHEETRSSLECFRLMLLNGVEPDEITFVAVLEACGVLKAGCFVHGLIQECGFQSVPFVGNALITMYGRCGSADESRRVFESMDCPNAVAWSSIIAALAEQGNGKGPEAMVFLWRMQLESVRPNNVTLVAALNACSTPAFLREGRQIHALAMESGYDSSDKIVGNALVNMFAKCGSLLDAREAFSKISHKDATSWNALITIYAQNQHGKIALDSLKRMQLEGFRMNKHTFVNAIIACTEISSLKDGKRIHGWIRERGMDLDVLLGNAVLNLYSKCGSLDAAYAVFLQLRREDVITWNAMVGAYARHGHAERALTLFRVMQMGSGTMPNSITFVSVLSACSHAGLLEEAHSSFVSMRSDYGIAPAAKHYVCMVDLLGRAGKFEEMVRFVGSSPVEGDAVVWRAVLAACRSHGKVEIGNRAVKRLLELEPGSQTAYIALVHNYNF
ncbi:pentatricopeptide repeat-containing protein At3g09040, mitochondrial-like [Selaginella moellendorffii]|uniref:pentatricopeptide repeat-containing protein At3g09040, mitochondrial-like n=1 Tax=Selaginella moellendorffii TaxID=88036 RepID=UPI000D1C3CBC|nr:pentatricopeptide repeat-containing protein At3g09040, mitochondrial-like [Selaginella moellendorffii]|eukprot:XP_024534805.1 pentatricopeptide repeat-containing protein At3g09040, mitochondrial-like [Selaginella moellendorffii]